MVINMKWNTRIDQMGPMDRQIKYLLLTIAAKTETKFLIWLGMGYAGNIVQNQLTLCSIASYIYI